MHSEGPWEADQSGYVWSSARRIVAEVRGKTWGQKMADARLIAAAPGLLAVVCRALVDGLSPDDAEALALIKRIEGEP